MFLCVRKQSPKNGKPCSIIAFANNSFGIEMRGHLRGKNVIWDTNIEKVRELGKGGIEKLLYFLFKICGNILYLQKICV